MSQLGCSSRLYDASPQGEVLEIILRGTYEWMHGREIQGYVKQMLVEQKPSGFVFNLLDYQYVGGHLSAPLIVAAYDLEKSPPGVQRRDGHYVYVFVQVLETHQAH